jgi:hypothetical protein
VGPGGGLAVDAVVGHAAVQDAHQPVAESADGLVVGVATGPAVVIVGAGARAGGQRGEGPLASRTLWTWDDGMARARPPSVALTRRQTPTKTLI